MNIHEKKQNHHLFEQKDLCKDLAIEPEKGSNIETNEEVIVEKLEVVTNAEIEEIFICKFCHKRFKKLESLKKHTLHHKENHAQSLKQTLIACNTKDRQSFAFANAEEIKKICEGEKVVKLSKSTVGNDNQPDFGQLDPFICRFCGKNFHYLASLERHVRIHTGNKPFKCKYCGRRFTQKVHQTGHERIHTSQRPFSCRCCHKGFTLKQTRDRHEVRCLEIYGVTEDLKISKFQCKICKKLFEAKEAALTHEQSCGKKLQDFTNKNYAESHKTGFHQDTTYSNESLRCSVCSSRFDSKESQMEHESQCIESLQEFIGKNYGENHKILDISLISNSGIEN